MMGDDCRDAIDGRYPFADSPQEVSADLTASSPAVAYWMLSGATLAPLADTASDPWRYKPTEGKYDAVQAGFNAVSAGEAADPQRVFNSEGGKIFPSMQISGGYGSGHGTGIDIDGQVLRYAHIRPARK